MTALTYVQIRPLRAHEKLCTRSINSHARNNDANGCLRFRRELDATPPSDTTAKCVWVTPYAWHAADRVPHSADAARCHASIRRSSGRKAGLRGQGHGIEIENRGKLERIA